MKPTHTPKKITEPIALQFAGPITRLGAWRDCFVAVRWARQIMRSIELRALQSRCPVGIEPSPLPMMREHVVGIGNQSQHRGGSSSSPTDPMLRPIGQIARSGFREG